MPTSVRSLLLSEAGAYTAPFAGTYRPWTPLDLPNLYLWLDAADASTFTLNADGTIVKWADKSGKNRHALGRSGINPGDFSYPGSFVSNGLDGTLPAVFIPSFGRLDVITDPTGASTQLFQRGFTVYQVSSDHNPTNDSWRSYWATVQPGDGDPNPGFAFIQVDGTGRTMGMAQPARANTGAASGITWPTGPVIAGITSGAGTQSGTLDAIIDKNGVDGAQITLTGYVGNSPYTGLCLGYPGYDIGGDVNFSEFIACETSLSNLDQQRLQGYLAWKWNRVGDLAANHPYKTAAPLTYDPNGSITTPTTPSVPATEWNVADKNSNVTIVSSREIKTDNPGGWYGVRTTTSKASGRYYFEANYKLNNANGVILGIGNDQNALTNYPGSDGTAVGFWDNGGQWLGGSASGSPTGGIADGDIISFDVDFDARTIKAARNGGAYTAVCDFASIEGPYHIIGSFNAGPVALVAAFKAADFVYTPPAGAVPWDVVGAALALIRRRPTQMLLG